MVAKIVKDDEYLILNQKRMYVCNCTYIQHSANQKNYYFITVSKLKKYINKLQSINLIEKIFKLRLNIYNRRLVKINNFLFLDAIVYSKCSTYVFI